MTEEISGMIQNMAADVIKQMNEEIQKELFNGLEKVGICVYIEQHTPETGLDKVLVVRNMRAPNHDTYKAAIGINLSIKPYEAKK